MGKYISKLLLVQIGRCLYNLNRNPTAKEGISFKFPRRVQNGSFGANSLLKSIILPILDLSKKKRSLI